MLSIPLDQLSVFTRLTVLQKYLYCYHITNYVTFFVYVEPPPPST